MAVQSPAVESFSFNGESIGASGAAALRGIKSLAERAPAGRLFACIATLAEQSAAAASEFEAASLHTLKQETAAAHLERGTKLAHKLKAALGAEIATPLPAFKRQAI